MDEVISGICFTIALVKKNGGMNETSWTMVKGVHSIIIDFCAYFKFSEIKSYFSKDILLLMRCRAA